LHFESFNGSASANLELPISDGPIRSVDAMTIITIVKLIADASSFIDKICILFVLIDDLT
jgi:hypothetical protein